MQDKLDAVSLLSFLDAYSEPSFILCSNASPEQSLSLVVLDEDTFFGAFTKEGDLRWLRDPTRPQAGSKVAHTHTIELRPSWLPSTHTPDKLELTATPITLPITLPGVGSSGRSFVFTASPSKISTQFARATSSSDARRDSRAKAWSPENTSPYSSTSTQHAAGLGPGSSSSQRPGSFSATSSDMVPTCIIDTFEWEKTSLGPRGQWPASLATMVQYIMAKQVPTAIYWGWPDLILIYNDSYTKLAGAKHPSIYAQKATTVWGEHWDKLNPVAELCRQGQSTSKANDPLFFDTLTEQGHSQESYYNWHWTPIWKEDGTVGGALSSYYETTHEIIAKRRLGCIADLISELSEAKTQGSAMKVLVEVLSRYTIDLPFVALYLCDSDDKRPRPYLKYHDGTSPKKALAKMTLLKATLTLIDATGIPEDHPATPPTLEYTLNPDTLLPHRASSGDSPGVLREDIATIHSESGEQKPLRTDASSSDNNVMPSNQATSWPFLDVFASGSFKILDSIPPELAKGLDTGAFGDQVQSAAMIPIPIDFPGKHAEPCLPHSMLVVGLNTRRPYDSDYEKWLKSISAAFSSRLMTVLQLEVDEELIRERDRLDQAKSRFFVTASHELRTPLTLIQAPLEQAVEFHGLAPAVNNKLELAIRNVERLHRLVDAILDIGMLEAGQLTGHFRPVHLERLTADLTSLFQGTAEKKKLELQFEAPNDVDVPPQTYVDIQLWEKIFCNLLSNAFKYTQEGNITVSVTYDSTSAYVRVADTGIGIPKAKQETVFEQFQRLNELAVEGFGIGLPLAKQLTELHGGKLTLSSRTEGESSEDTGSTFTVTIPLGSSHLPSNMVSDDPETSRSRPDVGSVDNKQLEHWIQLEETPVVLQANENDENPIDSPTFFFRRADTILLVDDSVDMRSFLRSVFEPYLTILEAGDGIQALEIAKAQQIDLILSDVFMPKMGGKEFLSKLHTEKKTSLVPVVFLTAASEHVGLLDGRTDGAVDCISKPFHIRDLIARVHLQLQLGKRRINLERSFAERTHELQTLIDFCPVGIFRTDSSGGMDYMNPRWHQITGYDSSRDKDEWSDHIHPDSRQEALGAWHRCFFDRKSSSIRLRWVDDSWTQLDITPLVAPEGGLLGAFGTVTDITDLHRLEEARLSLAQERAKSETLRAEDAEARRQFESNRRKEQELLIDVTSHELRQPISAILQNAEVIQTNMKALKDALATCVTNNVGYIPTEQTMRELGNDIQSLDSITQCGLSQARIADDILSLSGLQLEALTIVPVSFNPKREITQILSIFKSELELKNISLETTFGAGLEAHGPAVILTDRSRLTQIITNLMSNAIGFTETSAGAREIKVSIEIARDPPSDESCEPPLVPSYRSPGFDEREGPIYLYMSFQDSGPGLQKEDLTLLFERFRQGSNAHPVFGGSGLGLFVCRQLCGLMDGRIEVHNTPGSGATFRFFIRASKPPSSSKPEPTPRPTSIKTLRRTSQPSSNNGSANRSMHVLITEDNKVNQGIMKRQMTRTGFTTVLASNGAEAIDAVTQTEPSMQQTEIINPPFDVILMDLQMPVMDGFAATKEIRKLEAAGTLRTRHFIIAVTGNARSEQVQAAWESGVDKVIIKPYNLDELVTTMLAGPQPKFSAG